ncbi:MerR family transcriptional regulator [Thalassolituus sp. ST750PaO-4]|uniref:MerR family transcriptional regulator n=1 Tax=Thalassolituus sp. ST750PaO-4 TaxID=2742965 RepID=UPI000C3C86E1|nr:MerR family transcriptional regulator [Thalassolituus sp. ST750PaO-4]MCA6059428.1 MerR family transcriptional regulator [Thalassolituus sp. ST750PaO-4]PIQ41425.1 MAG: MerR family transcriptional regulator [Thalassolituus sp. CG17_big_fil_post_rev_8_21_14_2_50_53_8]
MNIKAFAEQTGVSAHTLRYYEKIGLLQVQRNQSGHRVFSNKDLEWITFILRLKDTGMPLQHIIKYAEFRTQGDSTMAERQQLLQQHRDILQARIARELEHLQILDNKIGYYRQLTGKV